MDQLPNLAYRLPRQPLRILLFLHLMLNLNFLFLLLLTALTPIPMFRTLPSKTQIRTPIHTPVSTPASRRTDTLSLTTRRARKTGDRR